MRTSAAARSASTSVDPRLQPVGALLDPVDPAVELALGPFGPLLDVEAGVLAQGVELTAQGLVLGARGALLGEHLFDAGADPLDLLVQLGAGALGGQGDRRLVAFGRWLDRIRHGVHPTGSYGVRRRQALRPGRDQ